jgi:hypothetical protein
LGLALFLALLPAAVLRAAGLAWENGQGYRSAPVAPETTGRVGFTLMSAERTGLAFTNTVAQSRYITNQIYLNGAGVAAGDVDGDGWCDLFFCNIDGPNTLWRNRGNWQFQDITTAAGVALPDLACTGATFADLDGDGDLDLVVNSIGGGTLLLFNDGCGHFTNPNPGSPLNYLRAGMTATLADLDGDGDLDLYVANYRMTTLRDMPNSRLRLAETNGELAVVAFNDRPTTDPDLVGRFTATRDRRIIENGEPDVLYLNDGQGRFTLVPFVGGAFLDPDGQPLRAPPYDWGLTATFRDLDGDGAPDLYVCNDFESPDRIWINDRHGRFRAAPRLALRQTSIFSMGIDFADLDRDGHDEFFVSDMLSRDHARRMIETGEVQPTFLPIGAIDDRPQYSHNTLFHNRGDGTFAELAQFAGVEASEWTWSPNFLDVDLDGYEDLLITSGHELQMMNGDIINQADVLKTQRQMTHYELQKLRTLFPRHALPTVAFRNRGNLTFEETSRAWGFDRPGVGNGVALADLDNDADLDVAINNLNSPAVLYRNDAPGPRLAVRLRGSAPNTQGIGARITVRGGPVPAQSQEIGCGGHYLSGSDAIRMFAAGSATNHLRIEVAWRSGRHSVLAGARPNRIYEVDESAATPAPASAPAPVPNPPWFEDASDRLRHVHHEDPFDDFARQPLLPRRLSQLGPGVSWADVNDDGADDLLVPSGKGGALALFVNRGDGTFERSTNTALLRPAARDQTTALSLGAAVLVGSCNYEDGTTNGGAVRIYDLRRAAAGESLLGQGLTTGPLAFGDIDGDGDLDLFVGGRVVPGRYPEPAASALFRKDGDRLVLAQRFDRLGLVSGATFSDLDGDGAPELILACEWGPIRILRRRQGPFEPWDPPLDWSAAEAPKPGIRPDRFSQLTGWWAGVASGDLDGDGRLDFVAANWGLNSRYRPDRDGVLRIRYADLLGGGALDPIESYIDPATGREVPRRGLRPVAAALPFLQEKAPTYEAYGKASLAELYGDPLMRGGAVEAVWLASTAFLNRGDRFEVRPLPDPAQWAPAFGVCIGDFDGDGAEDVFLGQNFFAVNPDEWRQDAGRGLWLRGDGHGGFAAVPGQESGVTIYGEQRGCALGDYDADGRPDLAVAQNGNATRLFHNVRARPGLRVRLRGPAGNPFVAGAALRLGFGDRLGPVREIQAGSGYWSQNSHVSVLATPTVPSVVWVRWPGGKTTTSPLPAGATAIAIDPGGAVQRLR